MSAVLDQNAALVGEGDQIAGLKQLLKLTGPSFEHAGILGLAAKTVYTTAE